LIEKASELLRRYGAGLGTGVEELDRLVGGLRPGALHILYGEPAIASPILYRAMVEAHWRGPVAYMNNTDYYGEKTLVDVETLSAASEAAGAEPLEVLESIYCVAAFNAERQVRAAGRLAEEVRRRGASLVAVHNASAFYPGGKGSAQALSSALSILLEAASEACAPVLATSLSRGSGASAEPLLPLHVIHRSSVLVLLSFRGSLAAARLVKHPSMPAPRSALLLSLWWAGMGRITPPFRQVYRRALERIRRVYRPLLRDERHRKALDGLVREVWGAEHAAIGSLGEITVLDSMNLAASIHNKAEIEELKKRLGELEERLRSLEEKARASED
jgi:replicative DNA helicase